jgi:hypothetical protein
MSTLKGLAVATALAGMTFSGAALADGDDDGSTTSVTQEGSVENLPDGSTVTTSTVTSVTETPAPTNKFGTAGDWVIGISRAGGISYSKNAVQDSNGDDLFSDNPWELNFTLFVGGEKNALNGGLSLPRWQFDAFIIENLSLGGGILVGYRNDTFPADMVVLGVPVKEKELVFGFEFKVGYAINFSDSVHWWPRVGVEWVWDRTKLEGGETDKILEERTFNALWIMADAPFVFDVTPGFAITFAPTFDFPIIGTVKQKVLVDGALVDAPETKAKILNMGGYMGVLGYF